MGSTSTSLPRKEYLKKYAGNPEGEKKKKKPKKKLQTASMGVLVVDEDPIWQKSVKIVEEDDEDDSQDEEKPQINEDIEFKHMKRMELIRSRQFVAGSGWVLVCDVPSKADIGHELERDKDLSPIRSSESQPHQRHDSPDLSPSRKSRPIPQKIDSSTEDILPLRLKRPRSETADDLTQDISTPQRNSPHSKKLDDSVEDISPPRRNPPHSQRIDDPAEDISPPRRNRTHSQRMDDSVADISLYRDDPELDKMLKERVRFGDPMTHLVKPKHSDLILEDFGENEKMKESGFIVPQSISSHSWIKRRIDAPPNRYGIKSGRHWDGVDRSNGYEKEYFKRSNEKQAREKEAYLWSVSDM